MLDTRYNPKDFEEELYNKSKKDFAPKGTGEKFSIMMPPPNVTGVLHMGHALTYSIQDIIVRYKRLKGFDVLWQPGTDHAGISTQLVVEKKINEEGHTKEEMGREEFVEKIWEWKEYSQKQIVSQQEKLGISPDWERSRFTLDEGLNKAVNEVFVKLYEDGLMYKAERLVNWDFKLGTALSDLEVISQEIKDKMYYIKYSFAGSSNKSLTIATTRPETIFADIALAVNPNDERYKDDIGKEVIIPLCGRKIPIIADEYSDPEKGTGVVKITPAHDFNDFEVGKRHKLESINLLDEKGLLNENVIEVLQGLTCKGARKKIEPILKDLDLLEKVEDIKHAVPLSERTGERIEPRLTTQWFCDTKPLAKPAIKAVKDGELTFIPAQWVSTYMNWLENIEPWCVSRQLWWGHQIPAWYGPEDKVFVAKTEEDAYNQAKDFYGNDSFELKRDEDVLDTWFSSALWPFSTLGWPEKTQDLEKYFPTDLLITGFDIIFFWVARMVMMSLYFTGKVPFKDVYIHALVRDEKGQKMSKSKGNVINPLDMIDQYGTDALRLSLCALAIPGRDISIGPKIVEGYRNFITKIWNAGRFLESRNCSEFKQIDPLKIEHPLNQWILSKFQNFVEKVEANFEAYRYDLIVKDLYEFVWDNYCDIYLEAIKPLLDQDKETGEVATWIYTKILSIMHPIIPFVTQQLHNAFNIAEPEIKWPTLDKKITYPQEVDYLLKIINSVRSMRGLLDLKGKLKFGILKDQMKILSCLQNYKDVMMHFLNTEHIEITSEIENGIPVVIEDNLIYILLEDADKKKEVFEILKKKFESIENDMNITNKLLENERFKEAKPEAFKEKLEFYQALKEEHQKIESILQG